MLKIPMSDNKILLYKIKYPNISIICKYNYIQALNRVLRTCTREDEEKDRIGGV